MKIKIYIKEQDYNKILFFYIWNSRNYQYNGIHEVYSKG